MRNRKDREIKSAVQIEFVEKPNTTQMVYCAACGNIVDYFFHVGQIVLVAVPGERRYFGRILNVLREDEGVFAKVASNNVETSKVRIEHISKVDG